MTCKPGEEDGEGGEYLLDRQSIWGEKSARKIYIIYIYVYVYVLTVWSNGEKVNCY